MLVREAGGDLKDLLSRGINRWLHVRRDREEILVWKTDIKSGGEVHHQRRCRGNPFLSPPFSMTTTATDNPAVGNFAMPSTQPQTVTTIFTSSGNGEEPTPDVLPSENIGNLTPSARTSRTRVDLLTTSPPGEITTTTRPARDEDGNGAPVQEPAREEARAEPTVSLSLLVLSGDRKTFTFSPDTTIRRVKEVIWTTWDAGMSSICHLGATLEIPDGVFFFFFTHLRLDKGSRSPEPLLSPCAVFGEAIAR